MKATRWLLVAVAATVVGCLPPHAKITLTDLTEDGAAADGVELLVSRAGGELTRLNIPRGEFDDGVLEVGLTAYDSGTLQVVFEVEDPSGVIVASGFGDVSFEVTTGVAEVDLYRACGVPENEWAECSAPGTDGPNVHRVACVNGQCLGSSCGDGIIDDGFERCDPSAPGAATGPGACRAVLCTACGDGEIDPDEECDDGNSDSSDGCSADCRNEGCGDGVTQDSEECDDGDTDNNDGCSEACNIERCGDAIVQITEECDVGDALDNDGCSAVCMEESCGDGIIQTDEECEDGNMADNDGCSGDCLDEYCGDGLIHPLEECDDGNTDDTDACSNDCKNPNCGNGIVQLGEECDDAVLGGPACQSCLLIECGNARDDPGETCDDGNDIDGDGCSTVCQLEVCGDGIIQTVTVAPRPPEECDDGNTVTNDLCKNDCTLNVCGDGVLRNIDLNDPAYDVGDPGFEQCDEADSPPSANPNDGCNTNCQLTEWTEEILVGSLIPPLLEDLTFIDDLAVDLGDRIYGADPGSHRIIRYDPIADEVVTIAGTGELRTSGTGDGERATSVFLDTPVRLDVDRFGRVFFYEDGATPAVRMIDEAGFLHTVVAAPAVSPAEFRDLAIDPVGDLWLAIGNSVREFRRYSIPRGATIAALEETIPASGEVLSINFSATGELYFMMWLSLYRLDGATATLLLDTNYGVDPTDVNCQGPFSGSTIKSREPDNFAFLPSGEVIISDSVLQCVRKADLSTGTVEPFAGTGSTCEVGLDCGDGGPADQAMLKAPRGVVVDSAGRTFVASRDEARIRVIDPSGTITTALGSGLAFLERYGDTTSSPLARPTSAEVDINGDVYIADAGAHVVWRAASDGSMQIVAGTGRECNNCIAGIGVPYDPWLVDLTEPLGLALDGMGNLFFLDQAENRLWKLDLAANTLTKLNNGVPCITHDNNCDSAGLIEPPCNGGNLAAGMRLSDPSDLAWDPITSRLFVANTSAHEIDALSLDANSEISRDSPVEHIAGKARWPPIGGGEECYLAGCFPGFGLPPGECRNVALRETGLFAPRAIEVVNGGHLAIADNGEVHLTTEFDGVPGVGLDDRQAVHFDKDSWADATLEAGGIVQRLGASDPYFVADAGVPAIPGDEVLRRFASAGVVTIDATCPAYGMGDRGPASGACVPGLINVARGPGNTIQIVQDIGFVRNMQGNGAMDTTAGLLFPRGDGPLSAPGLRPYVSTGVPTAITNAGDAWLFGDGTHGAVREIDPVAGRLDVILGYYLADPADQSIGLYHRFLDNPAGIAFDSSDGSLYLVERDRHVIWKTSYGPAGLGAVSIFAGTENVPGADDSHLFEPEGLAIDPGVALYVADTGNNVVRRIDLDTGNVMSTVIGTPGGGGSGFYPGDEGETAGESVLFEPRALAWGDAGLYVADSGNGRVRLARLEPAATRITTASIMNTVLLDEIGPDPPQGLGGAPLGLDVDSAQNLFAVSAGALYILPAGADGVANGSDRVFPAYQGRGCLSDVSVADNDNGQVMLLDACTLSVIRLTRVD